MTHLQHSVNRALMQDELGVGLAACADGAVRPEVLVDLRDGTTRPVYVGEPLASGTERLAGLRRSRVAVCDLDGMQLADHAAIPQVFDREEVTEPLGAYLADIICRIVVKGTHV